MKVTKEQKLKNNKGITLVALVITIIIMLILVAVTISMSINGGLFDNAGKAVGDTRNALEAEKQLANEGITIGEEYYNSIDEYINNQGNGGSKTTYKLYDTYTKGDYMYLYLGGSRDEYKAMIELQSNMSFEDYLTYFQMTEDYFWELNEIPMSGVEPSWQVLVLDTTKTSYGEILQEIDGIPVTNMDITFNECLNMIEAPKIPSSVTTLSATFGGCVNLKTYAGSTDAEGDFSNYIIPSGVTNMSNTFDGCSSLKKAPTIPSNVSSMVACFMHCTSLTGEIVINTNKITLDEIPSNDIFEGCCQDCFGGVDMTNITLTGSASKEVLNLIGSTGNNYTPIS